MIPYKSPVARSIPFDNSSNGFPAAADNVQTAIEQVINFDPEAMPAPLYDDFDSRLAWSPATTGGGAASVSGGNATFASGSHIGVARVALGTVLGSSGMLRWSGGLTQAIVVGGGIAEWKSLIQIPSLATTADDYTLYIGLGDSLTSNVEHANGIYFVYDRQTSANWILRTASQSTRTSTTSSIAVTAGAWIELRWVANAAGTSVEFFVGNTSAGTNTTNIPNVTGFGCGGAYQIVSVNAFLVGGKDCVIDYFYFTKAYTSRT